MKGARGPAWPYWQPTLNPLRCPRCRTLGGFARALERSSCVLWPDWIGSRVADHHWQRHCRAPPPAVVDLTSDCRPAVSAVLPVDREPLPAPSLPYRLKMPLKTWASLLCFFLRSTSAWLFTQATCTTRRSPVKGRGRAMTCPSAGKRTWSPYSGEPLEHRARSSSRRTRPADARRRPAASHRSCRPASS